MFESEFIGKKCGQTNYQSAARLVDANGDGRRSPRLRRRHVANQIEGLLFPFVLVAIDDTCGKETPGLFVKNSATKNG